MSLNVEGVVLFGAMTVGLTLIVSALWGPSGPGAVTTPSPSEVSAETVERMFYAPIQVGSDFAGALNGWALTAEGGGARVAHRYGPGSDGEPGFLRFRDGPRSAVSYLSMAHSHTGDQSGLLGGAISFDLRLRSTGAPLGADWPLLRIVAGDGTEMSYSDGSQPTRDAWHRVSVPMAPGAWRIEDRDATEAEMLAVLSDVARVEMRVEHFHGADEVVDLDEVLFEGDYGMVQFAVP